eukprot:9395401-Pyramimonas_sp.AAC.1
MQARRDDTGHHCLERIEMGAEARLRRLTCECKDHTYYERIEELREERRTRDFSRAHALRGCLAVRGKGTRK